MHILPIDNRATSPHPAALHLLVVPVRFNVAVEDLIP